MLDVRDPLAIRRLAAEVGEVDIVFSNAAARMSPDDDPADAVDVVADTNNTATTMMLREFAPRLRDGGRLIVVASALGTLDKLPASVRPRFAQVAAVSLDAVDRLVDEWRHSVKAGRAIREGFGSWLNIPSKVAQVAAVRAIARTRRSDDLQHGTLVMALCPGLIDTEASRPWFTDMSSAQTPRAAATWPVELALSDHFEPAYYGELGAIRHRAAVGSSPDCHQDGHGTGDDVWGFRQRAPRQTRSVLLQSSDVDTQGFADRCPDPVIAHVGGHVFQFVLDGQSSLLEVAPTFVVHWEHGVGAE